MLIAASQYEAANAARDDTSGKVYDSIATGGFASRCDAISRVVDTMMATLGKEKRHYRNGSGTSDRDREPLRHRR